MRIRTLITVIALVGAVVALPTAVSAQCDTEIAYDPAITTPADHADGFPGRQITTPEIVSYFDLVGEQSDRVRTDSFGTSIGGTDLVYSLVSTPENLARVDEISAQQDRLRDPRTTSPEEAGVIADELPAIVWYSGNVHGNEPSGADAATTILHELAARDDCEVQLMLDELVIGILPTQNPDGRDDNSRTNRYGFDMNRDWFAGSQPETAGKLELLKAYPPVLYIDAHQMGGSQFFFPPNADPIHHEISDASVDWINDLYGKAMQDEFDRRNEESGGGSDYDYFNYNVYDLFYMGYGDTMPSTAYGAAGMTFEKGSSDPAQKRHDEQFVAGWVSLTQAAINKDAILARHYTSHVQAIADGAAGRLEENLVVEPQNEVEFAVPDETVRHYFLLPGTSGEGNVNRLVDRLQRTAVEIHRLDADLQLSDAHRYGRDAGPLTIPAGAYWIPMEQPQKRWIQALLGEDPHTPFPYFYDVTSWSNPQLMDVDTVVAADDLGDLADVPATPLTARPAATSDEGEGFYRWSGDSADAIAAAMLPACPENLFCVEEWPFETWRDDAGNFYRPTRHTFTGARNPAPNVVEGDRPRRAPIHVDVVAELPADATAFDSPRIAVLDSTGESARHLRFMLDRVWSIRHDALTPVEVAAGALTTGDYDVFIVPGVNSATLLPAAPAIQAWVRLGGTYVGYNRGTSGGTALATQIGLTTARSTPLAGAEVGGTAFRVDVGDGATTVGSPDDEAFWFNLGDNVLSATSTGANPVTYATGEDFWFSGYGTGVDGLAGTSVVVHEAAGSGNVILFSGEPNYRAYTEGPSFLLTNALLVDGPADQPDEATDVFSATAAADVAAVMAAADAVPDIGPGRPITLRVAAGDEDAARAVLAQFTTDMTREPTGDGDVLLRIANPDGLDFESHPYIFQLRHAFERRGVDLKSALF